MRFGSGPSPSRWRGLVTLLFAVIVLAGPAVATAETAVLAADDEAQTDEPAAPGLTRVEHSLLMPFVGTERGLSTRLGFGSGGMGIDPYPDVVSLRAGWYHNWWIQEHPSRPNGMEFVQTIGVHQALTCPPYSANGHDRTLCPYVEPHTYIVRMSNETIERVARVNPGSLWLIGNEMDRRDWPGGGQDEMLPETYAVAYHDLYHVIKNADPTARVAIGGVIQPTPLRLEYLSKIWDHYLRVYGTTMPVDVWNVHNFILKENLHDYGASIPPGSDAVTGVLYPWETGGDSSHVSIAVFDQQIRAMRTWMRERGQQQKPLIVSEYGVLYRHIPEADCAEEVQNFMIATFDYFLNTRDCSLGYEADDCRLVQRWAWYSLDDAGAYNPYTALFNPSTRQMTSTGERFRDYSRSKRGEMGPVMQ